jgi:hypothetical protein
VWLEDFGHHPVLGRDEEGRVGAHQEDGRQDDPGPGVRVPAVSPEPEPEEGQRADADLGDLPGDQGGPLAVPVGQVAGQGAEQGPGGVEEDRHQRDGLGLAEGLGVDGEEHGRRVNGLVVEGGQELGGEQAEVRAGGQGGGRGVGAGSGDWHGHLVRARDPQ